VLAASQGQGEQNRSNQTTEHMWHEEGPFGVSDTCAAV
jgi:hypothetical protein